MPWMVIFIQLILPVLMLIWLALFPAAGLFALGLQVLSVGAIAKAVDGIEGMRIPDMNRGEMGNSGNSSEPHLHIHAQRRLPE
ncbi:hypothetical protein [Marinobacter sp.]|uniref:hypothetical protein n=1 Tax=Marinobacter sp. TaxID=50741 RepID=UPI003A8EF147